MKTFTRYYDKSINEWIETLEIHNRVVELHGMDVNHVCAASEDLQTECRVNPSYENTYEFRVLAKTTMRMIQKCRNRGDVRTGIQKPLSKWDLCKAVVGGIILGEIASDLWSGSDGKGGIRQHLK